MDSIADKTASFFSLLTYGWLFKTRDTVETETPDIFAKSLILVISSPFNLKILQLMKTLYYMKRVPGQFTKKGPLQVLCPKNVLYLSLGFVDESMK